MASERGARAQGTLTATALDGDLDAKMERELDDALKNTFSASDPITPPAERADPSPVRRRRR